MSLDVHDLREFLCTRCHGGGLVPPKGPGRYRSVCPLCGGSGFRNKVLIDALIGRVVELEAERKEA